ncbi:MAG: hypothetical protein R2882_12920 [Gemmatimonadales bacterium]
MTFFGDIVTAPIWAERESNRQIIAAARNDLPGVINDTNAALGKLKTFFQKVAAAGLYPAVPDPVK